MQVSPNKLYKELKTSKNSKTDISDILNYYDECLYTTERELNDFKETIKDINNLTKQEAMKLDNLNNRLNEIENTIKKIYSKNKGIVNA